MSVSPTSGARWSAASGAGDWAILRDFDVFQQYSHKVYMSIAGDLSANAAGPVTIKHWQVEIANFLN